MRKERFEPLALSSLPHLGLSIGHVRGHQCRPLGNGRLDGGHFGASLMVEVRSTLVVCAAPAAPNVASVSFPPGLDGPKADSTLAFALLEFEKSSVALQPSEKEGRRLVKEI